MKKKNKNQSKKNNNQSKKFVTIKGIDQIIKQDDLKGFTNFIKSSDLNFKEALFASDKLSYQVGNAKLPLMVSIVHQDALKIFKAVEKEVPELYKQEFVYQDNRPQPLLNHALKANGTKLLKYLIEKPNINLFFAERRVSEDKEFSIIHNLIYQLHIEFILLNNKTKISNNDLKETEKYISLYLDKLDLILGILKDKDKEFLSPIFHHGNDDSILVIVICQQFSGQKITQFFVNFRIPLEINNHY